jgi:hypothetical protein
MIGHFHNDLDEWNNIGVETTKINDGQNPENNPGQNRNQRVFNIAF